MGTIYSNEGKCASHGGNGLMVIKQVESYPNGVWIDLSCMPKSSPFGRPMLNVEHLKQLIEGCEVAIKYLNPKYFIEEHPERMELWVMERIENSEGCRNLCIFEKRYQKYAEEYVEMLNEKERE